MDISPGLSASRWRRRDNLLQRRNHERPRTRGRRDDRPRSARFAGWRPALPRVAEEVAAAKYADHAPLERQVGSWNLVGLRTDSQMLFATACLRLAASRWPLHGPGGRAAEDGDAPGQGRRAAHPRLWKEQFVADPLRSDVDRKP